MDILGIKICVCWHAVPKWVTILGAARLWSKIQVWISAVEYPIPSLWMQGSITYKLLFSSLLLSFFFLLCCHRCSVAQCSCCSCWSRCLRCCKSFIYFWLWWCRRWRFRCSPPALAFPLFATPVILGTIRSWLSGLQLAKVLLVVLILLTIFVL